MSEDKGEMKEIRTYKTQQMTRDKGAKRANSIQFYDYCVVFTLRREQEAFKLHSARENEDVNRKTKVSALTGSNKIGFSSGSS